MREIRFFRGRCDAQNAHLFALGRNATYAACKSVGVGDGDEILTPAFDCDGALQPFTVMGVRPRFYRINPHDFAIDIEDLQRKITTKTKLIHIVQYFGQPQNWQAIENFKRTCDVPILVDNAYSLYSSYEGRNFSSLGDLAFFSLRKELPLSDGALLQINNSQYHCPRVEESVPWVYAHERARALSIIRAGLKKAIPASDVLLRLLRRGGLGSGVTYLPPLYSDLDAELPVVALRDHVGEEFSCDYLRPMSRFARWQLGRLKADDFAAISLRRQTAYRHLVSRLQGIPGLIIMNEYLSDETVPFCLNLRVTRFRDEILSELSREYSVMAWPTLPGAVLEQIDDFPEVRELGSQIIQFVFPWDLIWPTDYFEHLDRFAQDLKESWVRHCGALFAGIEL